MTETFDYQIIAQRAADAALIDPLLDRTFGPDRMAKTVYRLREGVAPVPELCFSAVDGNDGLLASLRFWPIRIDDPRESLPAILLGPLAVEPRLQGRGIGRELVRHALTTAKRCGHRICVVVGEASYYGPFGFESAPARGLILPGPVDPARFQVLEIVAGALEGLDPNEGGLIGRAENVAGDRRGLRDGAVA